MTHKKTLHFQKNFIEEYTRWTLCRIRANQKHVEHYAEPELTKNTESELLTNAMRSRLTSAAHFLILSTHV